MFILYSIIAGVAIGYVSGGSLKWLAGIKLIHKWLVVCSLAIQLIIFSDIPFLKPAPIIVVIFHFISYICLLIFVVLNRKVHGITVIGAGIFLNALVIFLNGGYMPTYASNLSNTSMSRYAEAISQGGVVHNSSSITRNTLLPWLGDVFYLPSWIPFSNVFSIGDIAIAAGVCLYLIFNMKPEKNKETAK